MSRKVLLGGMNLTVVVVMLLRSDRVRGFQIFSLFEYFQVL